MTARTPDQMRDVVFALVADCSPNYAEITETPTLDQLRLDSLDVIELQLLIEMEFSEKRRFAFDDVQDAWIDRTTVGDVVAHTQQLLGVPA